MCSSLVAYASIELHGDVVLTAASKAVVWGVGGGGGGGGWGGGGGGGVHVIVMKGNDGPKHCRLL